MPFQTRDYCQKFETQSGCVSGERRTRDQPSNFSRCVQFPNERGSPSVRLRLQRGRVGGEGDHVVEGELFDGLLHERAAQAGAHAMLEIIELADEVAG